MRPPAAQGDITRAVIEGATSIGLIDGYFETSAAVWHKEILFALSSGVQVIGGASMGALRAAECAAYGMVPVGKIAARYASGELIDDAAVAQLHAPEELGCAPLTEAMVDVEPSIDALLAGAWVSASEASSLLRAARSLFFKDRTVQLMVIHASDISPSRQKEVLDLYRRHRIHQKRADALMVLSVLGNLPNRRVAPPAGWTFSNTPEMRRTIGRLVDRRQTGGIFNHA
jgi:hypothetical protein